MEDYDEWRYHYPEFATGTIWAKCLIRGSVMLTEELNKSK